MQYIDYTHTKVPSKKLILDQKKIKHTKHAFF